MNPLDGVPIHIAPFLPFEPTDGEIARHLVRVGLADVLGWIGEEVGEGPKATHAIMINADHPLAVVGGGGPHMYVSQQLMDRLRLFPSDDLTYDLVVGVVASLGKQAS